MVQSMGRDTSSKRAMISINEVNKTMGCLFSFRGKHEVFLDR